MKRILPAIFFIIGTSSAVLTYLSPSVHGAPSVHGTPSVHGRGYVKANVSESELTSPAVKQVLATLEGWLQTRETEFLAGSSLLAENLLRWSKFDVSGNYYLKPDELAEVVALSSKPWFWQLSPTSIQRKLETLSWIKSSSVSWSFFPLSLKFKIEDHQPWLVAEYEGHNWILSRALSLIVPLSSVKDSDLILELSELPRLPGLQPTTDEATYLSSSNARLRHAAGMIHLLELGKHGQAEPEGSLSDERRGLGFKVERYDLLSDGSLLLTAQDSKFSPKIRIAPTSLEEAEQVTERISAVLKDLAASGERAAEIDRRFTNQAVVR